MATIPQTIKLSLYEALTAEMKRAHRKILLARAYHDGNQPLYLTARQKKFLAMHDDTRFCLNVCRTVVTALCDELSVIGFETDEKREEKKVASLIQKFWEKNKLDIFQTETHEWAARDGQSFLLLGEDRDGIPTATLHEAWTDEEVSAWESAGGAVTSDMVNDASGTGTGVFIKYENNDIAQPVEYAAQYWYEERIDERENLIFVKRRTVYYPDRIERYYYEDGKWNEFESPKKWVKKNGKPIGVAAIQFPNKDLRPEAWDAIPQQDAINKTDADLLASQDYYGFRATYMWGAYPTTDGEKPAADNSNVLYFQPGQINGNANKKPGEAEVQVFEGSDPRPMFETLQGQVLFVAQITGTPVTRFTTTGQVASAETLKEQKDTLKQRAEIRKKMWGDSWKRTAELARAIHNAFSSDQLDETVGIQPIWRNNKTTEELATEKDFGVPEETIWVEMGKSPDQITAMKSTEEYRIKREKAIWDGYASASANGVTVEAYLKRIGLDEKEIAEITKDMGAEEIPPTEM